MFPSLAALRFRMYMDDDCGPCRVVYIAPQGKPMDPDDERRFWRSVETAVNVASMAR